MIGKSLPLRKRCCPGASFFFLSAAGFRVAGIAPTFILHRGSLDSPHISPVLYKKRRGNPLLFFHYRVLEIDFTVKNIPALTTDCRSFTSRSHRNLGMFVTFGTNHFYLPGFQPFPPCLIR